VSFEHTRSALAKIVAHRALTEEQKLAIEIAAALGEFVAELERRLDELRSKIEALAKRK
jgi:hypothetical protein